MIRTFILDAEYDKNEVLDVVIRDKDILSIKLSGVRAPLSTALIEIRNNLSYTSFVIKDCTVFQIPEEFYIPGLLQITVSELIDGVPVKTWTIPPILFHELTDKFSGHDVIARILAVLPRVDSIAEGLANVIQKVESLSHVVDEINTIVYDPLNIN